MDFCTYSGLFPKVENKAFATYINLNKLFNFEPQFSHLLKIAIENNIWAAFFNKIMLG